MLFKCPCGFVTTVDAMPADGRITCRGCQKTWAVSRPDRKRRRRFHIATLVAAALCALIVPTWPSSLLLLAATAGRVVLLKWRHRSAVRIALRAMTALIFGLIGAVALSLLVLAATRIGRAGYPSLASGFASACLFLRVFLHQSSPYGWIFLAAVVIFAAVAERCQDSEFGDRISEANRVAQQVIAVLAPLCVFSLFAQSPISRPAALAEARLQERYLGDERSNRRAQRRIDLIWAICSLLQTGMNPEEKSQLRLDLSSVPAAADALALAEIRLQGRSALLTGPPASQPGDAQPTVPDQWFAHSLRQWRFETKLASDDDAKAQQLDAEYQSRFHELEQIAATALSLGLPDAAPAIDHYFTRASDYILEHFTLAQIDGRTTEFAGKICRPGIPHEDLIREAVTRVYQRSANRGVVLPWSPDAPLPRGSSTGKIVMIKNNSTHMLQFWAVGAIVKEVLIAPGNDQEIVLDESEFHIILTAKNALATVTDLPAGPGHFRGEFTNDEMWHTVDAPATRP